MSCADALRLASHRSEKPAFSDTREGTRRVAEEPTEVETAISRETHPMPRGLRYLPPGWSVEVMTRTIRGLYLLPVTPAFRRIFVGILARAQEQFPVRIHAAVAGNNHYHLILTPDDAEQLSSFMEHVNSNLAREANRLNDWHGRFWGDRYHLIPISPEPEALEERLRYVLSNTIKEHLVAHISDWEGLHCGEALIDGRPMVGTWYARAKEYEARRQAECKAAQAGQTTPEIDRGAFMKPYELKLAPLPCWAHHSTATIRKRVAEMVEEIEAEAQAIRGERGTEPVGMEKIRNQDPMSRPIKCKRSPKPLCHAASRAMRDRMRQAYRAFVTMFREASLKVKFGDVAKAVFPKGSFPPTLPFTRTGDEFDPLADAGGSRAFAALLAASS